MIKEVEQIYDYVSQMEDLYYSKPTEGKILLLIWLRWLKRQRSRELDILLRVWKKRKSEERQMTIEAIKQMLGTSTYDF